MKNLQVHLYPYLSDNYGVLLHSPGSGETACIDTGDADATLAALEQCGWQLSEIWITHHHADHSDGVLQVKSATGAKVLGPVELSKPIAGIDVHLEDGACISFAGNDVHIMHTPGHTKDMINFYLPDEKLIFTGDTLFTLGCGRLFEDTAESMFNSLARLAALPPDTAVYGSHEYTLANAAFALSVDPGNPELQARHAEIKALREAGKPTVPSTIEAELACNPFLRANDPGIRKNLAMQDADDVAVFAEIRKRKDNF